jgi:hypothetical protein
MYNIKAAREIFARGERAVNRAAACEQNDDDEYRLIKSAGAKKRHSDARAALKLSQKSLERRR